MTIQNLLPHLQHITGQELSDCRLNAIGGGDINAAYQLTHANASWFIKVNRPEMDFMFEAEAAGLTEIKDLKVIRVPNVITHGRHGQYSFLVLEHIPLSRLSGQAAPSLGRQLAELHRQQQPWFGWHIDNTIGSTDQINTRNDNWVDFWRQQRLLKQMEFAADNGYYGKVQQLGERLADKLDIFFSSYQPNPSLLHGDLWGGNAAADAQGQPVIFDPACYYGDREADLAMTELFGGYPSSFYDAYQETYPLDPGYSTRKTLYNLYHILNHLNLFGSSYLHQAESMLGRLLAEC
jgi:protein-ribulosamine 3-kinase